MTDRPGHDRRYAINCGKISRELGFVPTVELKAGLRDTFDWYLANEPWWRSAMECSYRERIANQYGVGTLTAKE